MFKKLFEIGKNKSFLSVVSIVSTAASIFGAIFDDEIRKNETREIVKEILAENKK